MKDGLKLFMLLFLVFGLLELALVYKIGKHIEKHLHRTPEAAFRRDFVGGRQVLLHSLEGYRHETILAPRSRRKNPIHQDWYDKATVR